MFNIKTMFTGIMIGLSLYLVAQASVPAKVPEPPKKEFKTCEENILYRLNFYSELLVKLSVPYIWGGYWGTLGGDCSGQTYWVCHMAGLPVHRTTAARMWLDKGLWPGERVFIKVNEQDIAKFPDLLFWSYKPRKFGHVAFTVWNATDEKGRRTILFREASFSKMIFKETEMKEKDGRWINLVGVLVMDLTPGFKCELKK